MNNASEIIVMGTTYKILRVAIKREEEAISKCHTQSEKELHGHKMSAYKRLLKDLVSKDLGEWLQ